MTALFQPASLYPLIQRLRFILEAQRRYVLAYLPSAIRTGKPIDLSAWTEPMVSSLIPAMQPYWRQGLIQGRREVARVLEGRPLPAVAPELVQRNAFGQAGLRRDKLNSFTELFTRRRYSKALIRERRKDFTLAMSNPAMWSLHNYRVLDAIREATFSFCSETNATATEDLATAISRLRSDLNEGLEAGLSYGDLTEKVRMLFDTPRADMIAITESSRALNGGGLLSYEAAKCEGSAWLCTSDPCKKICLPLDGEERPFGVPFWVNPKGGPYAVVLHAPAHPFLFLHQYACPSFLAA